MAVPMRLRQAQFRGELLSTRGQSKGCHSCGTIKKHSSSKDPLYNIWKTINARCYSPNSPKYANYGGKGVTVCERWRIGGGVDGIHPFLLFKQDVGPRPSVDHRLNRIANAKIYSPTTVGWSTHRGRPPIRVNFNGREMRLRDALKRLNLSPAGALHYRKRLGMTAQQAIDHLVAKYHHGRRKRKLYLPGTGP